LEGSCSGTGAPMMGHHARGGNDKARRGDRFRMRRITFCLCTLGDIKLFGYTR